MKNVMGLLKKYYKVFLMFLILIFVQVILNINITKFNFNVINDGITNKGIVENIPKAIRRSKMLDIIHLLSSEEQTLLLGNYSFINSPYENYVKEYPILKKENIYVLNEDYSKDAYKYYINPIIILYAEEDKEVFDKLVLKYEIEDGISLSDFYREQDDTTKRDIVNTIIKEDKYKYSDEYIIKTFIKDEYKELGVNFKSLQSDCLRVGIIKAVILVIFTLIFDIIIINKTKKLMLELDNDNKDKFIFVTKYGIYSLLMLIISMYYIIVFQSSTKWLLFATGTYLIVISLIMLLYKLFNNKIMKFINKYKTFINKYLIFIISLLTIISNLIIFLLVWFGFNKFRISYRGIKLIYSLQISLSLILISIIVFIIIKNFVYKYKNKNTNIKKNGNKKKTKNKKKKSSKKKKKSNKFDKLKLIFSKKTKNKKKKVKSKKNKDKFNIFNKIKLIFNKNKEDVKKEDIVKSEPNKDDLTKSNNKKDNVSKKSSSKKQTNRTSTNSKNKTKKNSSKSNKKTKSKPKK